MRNGGGEVGRKVPLFDRHGVLEIGVTVEFESTNNRGNFDSTEEPFTNNAVEGHGIALDTG